MGASLWDQVWLPLLIGVAIQFVVAALCFLSVRLWNGLMSLINTQRTTVGESADDHPLPDGRAAAQGNGVPDLEKGSGHRPAEAPETQITDAEAEAGTLMRTVAEMDVPHSQQEEVAA